MSTITLNAYAKVNLGLDVKRRLENGYHEVKMIMQQIGVHDIVKMKKTETPEIQLYIEGSDLPADSTNLAYRAAELLINECSLSGGVQIILKKQIPIAAGLAGGSTDCAAVLKGMNILYELGLSTKQLCEYGSRLGADVPFCILGGTALSEGIGELLTPLPAMPECMMILVKPDIDVSTGLVYQSLKLSDETVHPDIDTQIQALETHNLDLLCAKMENLLETATIPMHPVINDIKEAIASRGAVKVLMSGSGPTVFSVFDCPQCAAQAFEELKELYPEYTVLLTQPVNV